MSIVRGEIVEIKWGVIMVSRQNVFEISLFAVDIPGELCYDKYRQVSYRKLEDMAKK